MKKAPITLLDYFVSDLTVSANREYKASKPTEFREAEFIAEPSVLKVATQNDPNRWQVTLAIKYVPAAGTNFPYAYNLVMVGFFRAEDGVAPENEERWFVSKARQYYMAWAVKSRELQQDGGHIVRYCCLRCRFTIPLRQKNSETNSPSHLSLSGIGKGSIEWPREHPPCFLRLFFFCNEIRCNKF